MGKEKIKSKNLEVGDTVHIISNIAIYKVSYEVDFETVKKEVMEECDVFFGDMSRPYNYEYFSIFNRHPYFEPVRKTTGKLSLIKLPDVSNIGEFSFEIEPNIIKKPLDKFKVQLVKDYIYQRLRKKIQIGNGNKRKLFYIKQDDWKGYGSWHTSNMGRKIIKKKVVRTGDYFYDYDYDCGNMSCLKNIKNHTLYAVDYSELWYTRDMLLPDCEICMVEFLGGDGVEVIEKAREEWHKNNNFKIQDIIS